MDLNTPSAGQGEATTKVVPSDKSLWTEFLTYWTDRNWTEKAWPLPRSEETARIAEHAIGTCGTLLSANHLVAEAICDVARCQQTIAFDTARAAIAAYPVGNGAAWLNEPNASWKRLTRACAEVSLHRLEMARVVTDTAFKVLHDTSGAAIAARTAGAPRP
jgi:hypothetical protein